MRDRCVCNFRWECKLRYYYWEYNIILYDMIVLVAEGCSCFSTINPVDRRKYKGLRFAGVLLPTRTAGILSVCLSVSGWGEPLLFDHCLGDLLYLLLRELAGLDMYSVCMPCQSMPPMPCPCTVPGVYHFKTAPRRECGGGAGGGWEGGGG